MEKIFVRHQTHSLEQVHFEGTPRAKPLPILTQAQLVLLVQYQTGVHLRCFQVSTVPKN